MSSDFSVVAILAAYNEADVIGHVVQDLIRQGVQVYFLDDGSTDGTVAAVEPFLNRGVIAIERIDGDPSRFEWERILRRKSELASELDANWFIHHDADEFRESPWPDVPLASAIQRVDALGFNAIDFALFDFWPTHDRFRPGDDVRDVFTEYTPAAAHDRVQVRCWRKTAGPVDLASTGGHEARFPARSVFPIRFVARHYPIRGQAHGERKILQERQNRFLAAERERGWHVQYDRASAGASFVRDPATMTQYDPERVRMDLTLRHRGVEALETELELVRQQLDASAAELERQAQEIKSRDAEKECLTATVGRLTTEIDRRGNEIDRWRSAVEGAVREIDSMRRSRSWRWTAPVRTLGRLWLERAR
jgi:hypothetical protein